MIWEKDEQAREASKMMEQTPSEEEIRKVVHELRESAQEKERINISFSRKGGKELEERIEKIVQMIIESLAERWEKSLRVGIIVSLFKKGAREQQVSDTVYVNHQAVIRPIVRLLENELGKTVFGGEESGGDVGYLWWWYHHCG